MIEIHSNSGQGRAAGANGRDGATARQATSMAATWDASAARPHGLGAIACTMRDLVRDTVFVTFDALRGRYDR